MTSREDKLTYITLFIISLFLFWDIGNVDAVRQGTEGMYLQIAKEMFEQNSFLTPLYHGEAHWSKPPLHFWFSMFTYYLTGETSLWAARFTMALISIWGMFSISKWVNRNFNIPTSQILIFIAASTGMIKYSRIFMMEIDLTILSVMASLKFYDYFNKQKIIDLGKASLLLGAAGMIKGPVAIVMCLAGGGLFVIFQKKNYRTLFLWAGLGILISSIWYLVSYYYHGSEFFDYFFLRENIGKFTAKSYPIRTVFQGLLLYALPWSLYLPLVFFFSRNNLHFRQGSPLTFLILNFLIFFAIWLIPNQRSHHYAIPSLPFFLILSYIFIFSNFKKSLLIRRFKISYNIINSIIFFVIVSLIAVIVLSFSFVEIYDSTIKLFSAIFSIIMLITLAIILFRARSLYLKFLLTFVSISSVWIFLLPVFYLPLVPQEVAGIVGTKKVTVELPKPYFAAESLNRSIDYLPNKNIQNYIKVNKGYIILFEYAYKNYGLKNITTIVKRWPTWKRKNRFKDIVRAVNSKNLQQLQDNVVLLKAL